MLISNHPTLIRLGWNTRVLTLDDFYEACAAEGVRVIDDAVLPRRHPGAFFYRRRQPFIALDYRLRGPQRALTAWHEFGHALCHVPGFMGLHSKTELQADRIAYPALIPEFLLNWTNAEICDWFGYPLWLVIERERMWRAFNE